ncbi:hypothetical protein M569_14109 [Genlisea aurea]|uniref:Uncharacterized protein n=1 Tax=Genlisea aurea TaxID=192259 RepID=S8C1W6_9LAMI|nr:hypothetical protein M569_14109 [Genlisea aurea]
MMIGDMGLHVTNSNNQKLKWKPVKKGRSSRKSLGRRWNSASKLCDFSSPRRDGEYSGSDNDKVGEGILGKSSSGKLESVPIKKRRHIFREESTSHNPPSLFFEDSEQPQCTPGDFSGIELLAAAASMDGDCDNSKDKILAAEDSLKKPENPDVTSTQLENSVSNIAVGGGNAECSIIATESVSASADLCRTTEDVTLPHALDRKHWDLNVLMDAWDEPCDAVAGTKDIIDDSNLEKRSEESSPHQSVVDAGGATSSQLPNLKRKENNSAVVVTVTDITGNLTIETDSCAKIADQNLRSSSAEETRDHGIEADDKLNCSASSDLCCTNGFLVSDEQGKLSCIATDMNDSLRSGISENAQSATQGSILHDMMAPVETSDIANRHFQNSKKSSPLSDLIGTFLWDGQSLSKADATNQTDLSSTFGSSNICSGTIPGEECVPRLEDSDLPLEESQIAALEGSSRSYSGGAHDETMPSSDGKIFSGKNGQKDSDIPVVDEDILTVINEGYDSPYEDGELRGSFMYSWEENECVDYESDGRKEAEAADIGVCSAYGLAEGVDSKRNSVPKRDPKANDSKSCVAKPPEMEHAAVDDCDPDEIAGRGGSNAGSGTTIDQSMEITDENGISRKRGQLTDLSTGGVDFNMGDLDEYGSKIARAKLQSRIEGRGFNGSIVPRQVRSRRPAGSSYSELERGISPGKRMERNRSANDVRDEDQWASWNSRKRSTTASDYRFPDVRSLRGPRSISNEPGERIGGQADNYLSKDSKRSSGLSKHAFIEREDHAGVPRRMPLAWGMSGGAARRKEDHHYYLHPLPPPAGSRDFEDFPHPRPVRFPPQPSSRRDRSFSPCSARSSHLPFPRRRSRSRSPTMWQLQQQPRRIRTVGQRTQGSRSPPDYRMEKMRAPPFLKPAFESSYGEGFGLRSRRSSSRVMPPQEKYGFGGDSDCGTFLGNNLKRRRSSPVRLFRRPQQRFDAAVDSARQPSKSGGDYYNRPADRSGKISFVKGYRFQSDYYDEDRRRQGGSGPVIHRGAPSSRGRNIGRRFEG